jgi:hypothetical protein
VTTAARLILTALTLTLIALLVVFAAAYAITGDFRYVAAGIACGLFAYCAAEPVRQQPAREVQP